MKGLNNIAKIFAKIFEVFHWVGTALMTAATVCAAVAPQWMGYFVGIEGKECCGAELNVYGFEVQAAFTNGNIDLTTFMLFGIGAVIILALMAMIFRNLHIIFKNSENATPFQKQNIKKLREIGFFAIAIPVTGFIMSLIIRLVTGSELAELSLNMSGIFMGIIIFCLTQYFIYGAELEKDIEGLV